MTGRHDLERVVQLADHFKVPAMVCVNKYDLNPSMTAAIEETSRDRGLTLLGRIPFDTDFTRAMVQGQAIFEYNRNSGAAEAVREVWSRITSKLELPRPHSYPS